MAEADSTEVQMAGCLAAKVMAMKHRDYPIYGVQFHSESIETEHGMRLLESFLWVCSAIRKAGEVP